MEMVKKSAEELAEIEEDKKRPVVCEVISSKVGSEEADGYTAELVEDAMARLNARALAAGMMMSEPRIYINILLDGNLSRYILTAICTWIDREKFEALQRKQALMGQPQNQRGA